ncbi:MAG: phosphoglucomutase/phosphomannomutase family protein [Ignavibacteria bacterium]|jgi:phosphomannomutase|nr:phosphoglucomutase/phosphomannomutase family protein [Ignavibacteria bacterium]
MIKFGTDGWRAEIARDFTFENLRYVAMATAKYINSLADEKRKKKVPTNAKRERPTVAACVVGYDTRFLSKEFAYEVAMVLASQGVIVHLTDDVSSTPQVSFNTKQKGVNLGIVITASHNPPKYNGFKLKAAFGGPATPEQIALVEKELAKIWGKPLNIKMLSFEDYVATRQIRLFNAKESYIRLIKKKIDVEAIHNAKFKMVFDMMYGAGINTVKTLLPTADEIHDELNPSFGNLGHPEPIAENLYDLSDKVRDGKYDVGFAFDGDADRLGAVDNTGEFVDSHKIFLILLKYLVEVRKKRAAVVKTVSLTSMVDMYCEKKHLEMIETPVGFKYVAELMSSQNVLIGGEESGGLATILHIPERDGLFNAMFLLEVMAVRKKSLRELCQELDEEFGPHRYMRRDKTVTQQKKEAILAFAEKGPAKIGKEPVLSTNKRDGYKFFVENGWVLIRASGTEPLVRIYAEADSLGKVSQLIEEVEKWGK